MAQNAVDTETLRKADEIMAKVKTANSSDLPILVSQFRPLLNADGLSTPCRTLMFSMQTKVSATTPSDVLASMPEAMKSQFKAQSEAGETKLATERKACIEAASAQTPAQADKTVSSSQRVAKGGPAESSDEQLAEDENVPIHDRLVRLRGRLDEYFQAKNEASLERLNPIFDKIAKDKAHEINCRLAASSSIKQIQNSLKSIRASDDDGRNFSAKLAKVTATLVEGILENCE